MNNILVKNYTRYKLYAALALAESAREYAQLYRDYYETTPGLFEHDGVTYYSCTRKKGDESILQVECVGSFTFRVVCFYKDTSNPENPKFKYILEITPKGARPTTVAATGKNLATPTGLNEFLLDSARVNLRVKGDAFTALATKITNTKRAPEVNQVALTGYDVTSKWYIYKHFAIDPPGKIHKPDDRGLYKLSTLDYAAPPNHSAEKAIKPAENGLSVGDIHRLIITGWGENGATALAWATAALFVNQIKKKIGYFPFLSLYGDPGSGKSALTVILNAMQGLDGEGLPVSQLNTKKAMARSISRVSGLFTALLEDNQRNERAFDYSITLTSYNKGPLQLKAAFTNDNQTSEAPFRGALMFVQNTEPFDKPAEKQRVISLFFEHSKLTDQTREAYEQLVKIPLQELARALPSTLTHRKIFEENWFEEYQKAIEDVGPAENRRILQNHALILAFNRIFCKVHNINCRLVDFLNKKAQEKCDTSKANQQTLADHFFEQLDNLEEDKTAQCIHIDQEAKLIHINLVMAEKLLRNQSFQAPTDRLMESLTKHPAFVRNKKRFRFPADPQLDKEGRPKQRRTWVFDANKFQHD